MHSADDLVTCLDNFNGHIGRHIVGLDEVHEGYMSVKIGREKVTRAMSGEIILCQIHGLREREVKRNVAFKVGENKTYIDLIATLRAMKVKAEEVLTALKIV